MKKSENSTLKDFGVGVAEYRKRQHMSRAEFADRLHISRVTVFYWETGIHSPSFKTFTKVVVETGLEILITLGVVKRETEDEKLISVALNSLSKEEGNKLLLQIINLLKSGILK